MRKLARTIPVGILVSVALIAAPSALAATQVGTTFDPSSSACSQDRTWLQAGLPPRSNLYVVPFDGVITSWSFLGGSIAPSQIRLKVGVAPGPFVGILGESALETPAANTLNTFSSRIPVHVAQVPNPVVIGFYFPSPNSVPCADTSAPGYADNFVTGDIPPGVGFPATSEADVQLDVSAQLEPDADHDGFGDETQDLCRTDGSTQGPCPVTPVTSAKKKKCKKKKKKYSAEIAKKKCKKKKKK